MKKKIIIDCDPGIDDSLALMYALSNKNIDIVAITLVCGNAPVDLCFKNTCRILEIFNRNDIPIYIGASSPIKKKYISAQDTHGEDGLGETNFDYISKLSPQKISAANFLSDYFTLNQDTSVIALGPLTNFCLALELNKNLGSYMNRFISMGGCYKSFGNCSPVAEYNYWCDPHAAKYVFKNLKKPIEMICLDVTRKIVLNNKKLNFLDSLDNNISTFIRNITKFYFDFHLKQENLKGCVINDPLAVAHFVNSNICSGFSSYTNICISDIAEGQSIVDDHNFYKKEHNSIIYTDVNVQEFFAEFISTIFKCSKKEIYEAYNEEIF